MQPKDLLRQLALDLCKMRLKRTGPVNKAIKLLGRKPVKPAFLRLDRRFDARLRAVRALSQIKKLILHILPA